MSLVSTVLSPAGIRCVHVAIDRDRIDLDLYGQAPAMGFTRTVAGLGTWMVGQGRRLLATTNSGIFGPSERPEGLHVERGIRYTPLNTRSGAGNFYLQPNGIFVLSYDGRAQIVETSEAPQKLPGVARIRLALQSGPLLCRAGVRHPAFSVSSPNMVVRSGVGVDRLGLVHWLVSLAPITFWDLTDTFLQIGCPNALYLDGAISTIWQEKDPIPNPPPIYSALLACSVSSS